MSRDAALEAEIQSLGLNAPRVKPEDLDAAISHVEFVKHVSHSGQVLRWCVLTLQNGFAVAGKPSCAASSANDNAFLGEKTALANSRDELWPLLGHALKDRLHSAAAPLSYSDRHPLHASVVPDRSLD